MSQTFIPGTEPPEDPPINVEIATAIDAWLAAKKKQALAAETAKIRHESLMALMAAAGLERYPYHDDNGVKRFCVADKTPRAKTVKAPKRKTSTQERREEKAEEKRKTDAESSVESRRVKRTAEHDRLSDPFAATRAGMAE